MASAKNMIDLNALKFNQICISLGLLVGFVFNISYLPIIIALIMLLGSLIAELSLFKQIYRNIIIPLKLASPHIVEGTSKPHTFAQAFGGVVLVISSIFLFYGEAVTGWAITWMVIILALANIVFGFCAGCFIYFQLGRFGVPGFRNN